MIDRQGRDIWIEIGDFSLKLNEVPIGKQSIQDYKAMERGLFWITNDKMKVYILGKMLMGHTEEEAINLVLSKEYIKDADYRRINHG